MSTSQDGILTTHCGSLPRPPRLSELLLNEEAGSPIEQREPRARMRDGDEDRAPCPDRCRYQHRHRRRATVTAFKRPFVRPPLDGPDGERLRRDSATA